MTEQELEDERDLNIQVALINMDTQLKFQNLNKADVARRWRTTSGSSAPPTTPTTFDTRAAAPHVILT